MTSLTLGRFVFEKRTGCKQQNSISAVNFPIELFVINGQCNQQKSFYVKANLVCELLLPRAKRKDTGDKSYKGRA